jgi:ribose transport system permease protein
VDRVKIIVFMLVGMTAALSGVMLTAQLMIVDGTLGVGLELRAIAVAVLGGTSLAGGSGNLLGTLLASLLLSAISSALNILKVPPFYQYMALGLLLIIALSLDTLRRAIIKRAVTGGAL